MIRVESAITSCCLAGGLVWFGYEQLLHPTPARAQAGRRLHFSVHIIDTKAGGGEKRRSVTAGSGTILTTVDFLGSSTFRAYNVPALAHCALHV